MKSAFCWNMYGIVAKTLKKYTSAAGAFLQCLKLDPKNQRVQRETADLYLYSRDYAKHEEMRMSILQENGTFIPNWNGYIIATFLVVIS